MAEEKPILDEEARGKRTEKGAAVSLKKVMEAEIEEIEASRKARKRSPRKDGESDQEQEIQRSRLVGLAFSGGGIRSATFNLGVLQALASFRLLSRFHYLSAVSGGGYIGSWLAAWIKQAGGMVEVEKPLSQEPSAGSQGRKNQVSPNPSLFSFPLRKEPKPLYFLRKYSNYLTPRTSLLGADTWTVIGIYLRNFFLNLTILVLALLALLILPRFLAFSFHWIAVRSHESWPWKVCILVLVCIFLGMAFSFVVANLSSLFGTRSAGYPEKSYAKPGWIHLFVVLPVLAGSWWLCAWLWASRKIVMDHWFCWSLISGGIYVGLWLAGWLLGEVFKPLKPRQDDLPPHLPSASIPTQPAEAQGFLASVKQIWSSRVVQPGQEAYKKAKGVVQDIPTRMGVMDIWRLMIPAYISGAVGSLLLVLLVWWMNRWGEAALSIPELHAAFWGFPLVILIFLITETLHIGLAGRGFSEDAREWWGRLGGTLLLWTLSLSALFALALDGPWLLQKLEGLLNHAMAKEWIKPGLILSWLATTIAGILAGKSPATGSDKSKPFLDLLGKIAPPVFVVGLLLILAQILPKLIESMHSAFPTDTQWIHLKLGGALLPSPVTLPEYGDKMESVFDSCLWLYAFAFLGGALALSWRVGINDFSMHALYRNRLVRCYLGAPRADVRKPHPYTGFDPQDDGILMSQLKAEGGYDGPYPIINTTLNLVSGDQLAWQQRKAASFVFTPRYCGYEVNPESQTSKNKNLSECAYRPTESYGGSVSMGTAMAISGAAAAPNMGYHSSPLLAFLMTVFNVRLGWWLGNPRHQKAWQWRGPKVGLFYLFFELLGMTNDRRRYVYLSDGGHFENLGIYELVRRGCRFIVACDAAEDHEMKFGDLGNAIEKCRTDFGVDIEIDVEQLHPGNGSRLTPWHCAVGTIHYQNAPAGTLLYVKSSLTGDEPADVRVYAARNPEFPHQTTADQWFDESQFESYRALGYHIIQSVLEAAGNKKEIEKWEVEELFENLRQYWFPPSASISASFTRHTASLNRIFDTIRTNEHLKFLDAQIYPEWSELVAGSYNVPVSELWIPSDYHKIRAGFYVCNQMIQLMEDVYLDLNLDKEHAHPDNRGWMNLFKHWSWSGMFRATWAIGASTYGTRFQNFCKRHLGLDIGKVEIAAPVSLTADQGQRDRELKKAEKRNVLNFEEIRIIHWFIDRKIEELKGADGSLRAEDLPFPLQVLPLKIAVEDPMARNPALGFTFGFALVQEQGDTNKKGAKQFVMQYFRVQDHLRAMGLARRAIKGLVEKYPGMARIEIDETPSPEEQRFAQFLDSLGFQVNPQKQRPAPSA